MSSQITDTCAPGVKESGAEVVNVIPDLVHEHNTYVRCKKCGSPNAMIHSEEWSDGLFYSDYGCPDCGYQEVYE